MQPLLNPENSEDSIQGQTPSQSIVYKRPHLDGSNRYENLEFSGQIQMPFKLEANSDQQPSGDEKADEQYHQRKVEPTVIQPGEECAYKLFQ